MGLTDRAAPDPAHLHVASGARLGQTTPGSQAGAMKASAIRRYGQRIGSSHFLTCASRVQA